MVTRKILISNTTAGEPSLVRLALSSAVRFTKLVRSGGLHLSSSRLGRQFDVEGHGTYAIFRDTRAGRPVSGEPAVLIVGFRLKLLRSSRLLHWLFQRFCILTTPFWSGFRGFGTKLWMVGPESHDYLGIYQWFGPPQAQIYVNALVRVLVPLSTRGSVWYRLLPGASLDHYLAQTSANAIGTLQEV